MEHEELLRARRAAPLAEPAPVAPGRAAPTDRLPFVAGRPAIGTGGRPQLGFGELTGTDRDSFQARVGLLDMAAPGRPATGGMFTGSAGAGTRVDARGETVTGVEIGGAAVRVGVDALERAGVGFDAGVGTAQAGLSIGPSTTQVGAQANLAEGAISVGTPQHNVRLGASWGLGTALRMHYGDADNNGIPEYGIGADIGPVSFDVRSEMFEAGRLAAIANRARIGEGIAARAAQPAPADPDDIVPVMPRLGLRRPPVR